MAGHNLQMRPSVALAYAASAPLLPGSLASAAYLYLVLLQMLWYCAASWVGLVVWRARAGTAALVALALTVGFYGQYVFDINAWAQMAGIPLSLVALGVGVTLLARAGSAARSGSFVAALAPALATVTYVYPEALMVFALPWAGVAWAAGADWRLRLRHLRTLALAALVAAAMSAPYAQGTLMFLGRQFTQGVGVQPVPGWAEYFHAYLSGDGPDALLPIPRVLRAVHGLFGALGLYFLAPPRALPAALHALWELGLLAAAGLLLVALARAAAASLRRGGAESVWVAAALAAPVGPLALWVAGLPWQAGKVWSTLAPVVFLTLAGGLLGGWGARRAAWAAAVFLGLHVGFGLARTASAVDRGGQPHPPPYPSALDPRLKLEQDWDLARLDSNLAGCRSVALALDDPWAEAFVTLHLADRGLPWSPRRRQREYQSERAIGPRDLRPRDCVLASGPVARYASERVVVWPSRAPAARARFGPDARCAAATEPSSAQPHARGDFDGDGRPDLLFQDDLTGQVFAWPAGPDACGAPLAFEPLPEPRERLAASADLDGDGRVELLFQADDGGIRAWFLDARTPTRRVHPEAPLVPDRPAAGRWRLVCAADVDRDGRDDLLWQDEASDAVEAWTLDGTRVRSRVTFDPDRPGGRAWRLVAAPDVNGDGAVDLLWRNSVSGRMVAWLFSRERRRTGGFLLTPDREDAGWEPMAWFGAWPGRERGTVLVWSHLEAGQLRVWRVGPGGVRREAWTPPAPAAAVHGAARLAGPR
jgi:hypothetical protein